MKVILAIFFSFPLHFSPGEIGMVAATLRETLYFQQDELGKRADLQ